MGGIRRCVSFASPHAAQVNAVQDQSQLPGIDPYVATGRGVHRQFIPTRFQSFVPDRQAVAVEPHHLHPVPSAIDEHEQRTVGQPRRVEVFGDQTRQAVEALAHVRGQREQVDRRRIAE